MMTKKITLFVPLYFSNLTQDIPHHDNMTVLLPDDEDEQ